MSEEKQERLMASNYDELLSMLPTNLTRACEIKMYNDGEICVEVVRVIKIVSGINGDEIGVRFIRGGRNINTEILETDFGEKGIVEISLR